MSAPWSCSVCNQQFAIEPHDLDGSGFVPPLTEAEVEIIRRSTHKDAQKGIFAPDLMARWQGIGLPRCRTCVETAEAQWATDLPILQQYVVDEDETQAAYKANLQALEVEQAKESPDRERLAILFRRVALLQSALGDLDAGLEDRFGTKPL